jgi:hypothetical protein
VPLAAACLAPFLQPPTLQVGYRVPSTGQVLSRSLELPLIPTKFAAPVEVPAAVFAQRWQQVAGPPFKLRERVAGGGGGAARGAVEALLAALNFKVLAGVPGDAPATVSAACVFHCGGGAAAARQVPCMVVVEGTGSPACTVAVATPDATTTDALKQRLVQLLRQL